MGKIMIHQEDVELMQAKDNLGLSCYWKWELR